jgi:hypothetical protein
MRRINLTPLNPSHDLPETGDGNCSIPAATGDVEGKFLA